MPDPLGSEALFEMVELVRDLTGGDVIEDDVHLDAAGLEVRARRRPRATC